MRPLSAEPRVVRGSDTTSEPRTTHPGAKRSRLSSETALLPTLHIAVGERVTLAWQLRWWVVQPYEGHLPLGDHRQLV